MLIWHEPPTILVVEDDDLLLRVLSGSLGARDYAVAKARDGHEALDWLASNPLPHLILLDIGLPKLDGWQFLNQFREMQGADQVPVIVLSGLPVLGYAQQYPNVRAVVSKPCEMEALLKRVTTFVRPL